MSHVSRNRKFFVTFFEKFHFYKKSSTLCVSLGLVTLNEMKAKRESAVQEHEKRIAQEKRAAEKYKSFS